MPSPRESMEPPFMAMRMSPSLWLSLRARTLVFHASVVPVTASSAVSTSPPSITARNTAISCSVSEAFSTFRSRVLRAALSALR